MKRQFSIVVAVMIAATAAHAGNPDNQQARLNKKLHGEYSFVSHEQCVSSASGFGPAPNFQALGSVSSSSATILGTQVFDGNGNGVTTAHSLSISSPPTDGSPIFPISESAVACTATYAVHADDTVDMDANCTSTQVAGRFAGLLTLVSGPTHYKGLLLGKEIHLARLNAAVATTQITIGPSYQATSAAICSGDSISTKLPARDQPAAADDSASE